MKPDAIGGYLPLELSRASAEYHPDALRFQSSRAAFLALLRARRPAAVCVPWYCCDSVVEPLITAGIAIRRYAIDAMLRVESVDLKRDEWLLYVNYFGLCDRNVDDVLNRYGPERVVIDNAQAFFAMPRDCVATLYSPRKFVGVPDGGYLLTREAVTPPVDVDHESVQRFAHLLKRIDAGAEAGYADYAAAEASLENKEPLRMSALTQRILQSVDYADLRAKRVANFAYLRERLDPSNAFKLPPDIHGVPLCYPYRGSDPGLRARLMTQRIYTPCYWPEVASSPSVPAFEKTLAGDTAFLPCDQRLSPPQLDTIVQAVLESRDSL